MSSSGYAGAVLVLFGLVAPLVAEPDTSSSRGSDYTQGAATEFDGKDLKEWVRQLGNPDPSKREKAVRAIPMFGAAARTIVVPHLTNRLRDTDASVRVATVFVLRILQPYLEDKDVPKVVERVAERVLRKGSDTRYYEPQAIVRFEAVMTLAKFGDKAHPAMGALVQGVTDPSTYQMRLRCVQLLRHLGRKTEGADPEAVKALLQVLNGDPLHGIRAEPTFDVRLEAIMGLGALGRPKPPPAPTPRVLGVIAPGAGPVKRPAAAGVSPILNLEIRTLLRYAKGPDKILAIWAFVSLMALEDTVSKQHLEELAKYIKDKKFTGRPAAVRYLAAKWIEVRMNAIRALGAVHERAKPMTAKLLALTDDKNLGVVTAVYYALEMIWEENTPKGTMHKKAKEAFDAVIPFLKHESTPVRIQAAGFFAGLGPKAKPALPALINTLKDADPFVVMSCVSAIAMIGDTSETTLNALVGVLDRKESDVLRMTCMAFLQLDKPDAAVLKALNELLGRKDLQPDVKDMVKETIKKLNDPKKPKKVAKD